MSKVFLSRRARFSAAHRLHSDRLSKERNRELFGECNYENGHGHNYDLEVTLYGELDPDTGLIINLRDFKGLLDEHLIRHVDHRNLNLDVPFLKGINPSIENLVVVFWNILEPHFPAGVLYEVRLRETENNVAFCRGR